MLSLINEFFPLPLLLMFRNKKINSNKSIIKLPAATTEIRKAHNSIVLQYEYPSNGHIEK